MADAPTQRTIATNGVELAVTEAGEGFPVVFCHGFPELAYSWRHQIPAVAAAGYHAIAADQRGYGGSSKPAEISDYDIIHLTDDMLGLLDALGEEKAVFVGHDWGAPVVWGLSQRAPERVAAVVGMSVPFIPRAPAPPTQLFKAIFTDTFFYMLYFQEPGVADANLGADPAVTMTRFLCAIGGEAIENSEGKSLGELAGAYDGRGFVERLPEPDGLPSWLTQAELDHYIEVFTETGFTGGLNWYRNLDRNWERTPELAGVKVEMPALFIGGATDPVLMMSPPSMMEGHVTDLRGSVIVPGAGHWVQQEAPDAVNKALLDFLGGLDLPR
ncbi:MAG TPA: alpha/beta hydrolase [Acidimicrobiales bacterium]|jgi:pimeloyl-ACP methyl ester carboxylesterase|nr:alpha/beta hydrolase [Acidimicrobiales bacterium]